MTDHFVLLAPLAGSSCRSASPELQRGEHFTLYRKTFFVFFERDVFIFSTPVLRFAIDIIIHYFACTERNRRRILDWRSIGLELAELPFGFV